MTLTSAGDGYGAGGGFCSCILVLNSNGTFSTLHQDALSWRSVKLAPDGTLFAIIWAGEGQGLYTIDRTTGTPTQIVTGGPGPGGAGWYGDMIFDAGGALYANGYDGTAVGLFRLVGGAFTRVITLPGGAMGIGLTRGPAGVFYTARSIETTGDVWVLDPGQGTATLLASDLAAPAGVAYNPATKTLYVAEQHGSRQVWVITKDGTTPVQQSTWGSVKTR